MLTDDETRTLLREAVSDLTVNPPAADFILRQGRSSRRRTRVLRVASGAAAVTTVVVGSAVALDGADRADRSAAPVTPAPTASSSPDRGTVAQRGTRLVGVGRVAVAVPRGWGTNEVRCGEAIRNTVIFFDPVASREKCSGEMVGPSSLTIAPADSRSREVTERIDLATDAASVGGLTVRRSPVPTRASEPATFTAVLVVPDENVVMWARSSRRHLVDRIVDSLRRLAPDEVVVPPRARGLKATTTAIRNAGLRVREHHVYRSGLVNNFLMSSDPPLGSVVPRGSTVTLRVSNSSTREQENRRTVDYLHQIAAGISPPRPQEFGPYQPVTLALGNEAIRQEHLVNLYTPRLWVIHRRNFAGYVGPFSAREYLKTDPRTWTVTENGPRSCTFAGADDVPGFEHDRRLTIEPAAIDSCTEWWAVDVYVTQQGAIDAVSLKLVEP